ncbi:MAG TPA: ribosome biogenesis GTPase Der [Alphaproteobacteria bacterium]|jgi:GTP-binding protein|nr:ribosome biogenesis GTPase Der [Alphaproteobacteria bacterium]
MLPKVVIFGRPNVGKSTLFNRLVRRKAAIVADLPGVTRDNKGLKANLGKLEFILYDTAGFDEVDSKNELSKSIINKISEIINLADIIIFMLDARTGIIPFDYSCAKILRKVKCPILLTMNKVEGEAQKNQAYEAIKLGYGEPLIISAEHGIGLGSLEENLSKLINNINNRNFIDDAIDISSIRLAIVGRPNSGKSTLINTLIGEHTVLTGDQPGVTRDSIMLDLRWKEQNFQLVDTAGIRKKSKVVDKIEKLSVKSAIDTVKYAQIVILVLDCNEALSRQDLAIASHVIEEGRVLVIAANKWDIVVNQEEVRVALRKRLDIAFSQLKGVHLIEISALNKIGIDHLMNEVMIIYDKWNTKISTAKLNRWLTIVQQKNPPPLKSGRVIKIKYCTQVNIRPPTFVFFTNLLGDFEESYKRYLLNNLRNEFELYGVPLRLMFKNSKNPYI